MIVPRSALVPIRPHMREALRERYPHPERIAVAIIVARDVDTCADLLRGFPVSEARLDRAALRWAADRRLVRLDLRAIDLLTRAHA